MNLAWTMVHAQNLKIDWSVHVQMAIQVNYVRVSKYIVDSVRLITLFLLIYQMILETFHHIYAYDMQKSLNIPGS